MQDPSFLVEGKLWFSGLRPKTIIMIYAPMGRMISHLRCDDIRYADDIFALQIFRKLSLGSASLYYCFSIIRSEATLNIFRKENISFIISKIYHIRCKRIYHYYGLAVVRPLNHNLSASQLCADPKNPHGKSRCCIHCQRRDLFALSLFRTDRPAKSSADVCF